MASEGHFKCPSVIKITGALEVLLILSQHLSKNHKNYISHNVATTQRA